MANVVIENNTYTVESLYQWDINQVLQITGLSLPSTPEIHFTNEAMGRAIVRQATMNDAGVITVNIPNSLLQKPYKILVYVCIYECDTFESLYRIIVPVKARKQPEDYVFEDTDGEIYSYNALENLFTNSLKTSLDKYEETNAKYVDAVAKLEQAIEEYNTEVEKTVEATDECNTIVKECTAVMEKTQALADACQGLLDSVNEGKGVANGIATLDENALIPIEQINVTEILANVVTVYSGTEDPDDSVGKNGDIYMKRIS